MPSLNLPCPKCGANDEISLTLDLNDMREIECKECDESFTAQDAAEFFRTSFEKWVAVAEWIASAPTGDK